MSSSTTIILCRHGESEGNRKLRFGGHSPTPLTELGRAQARATGRLLVAANVDALYTSDLPRAMETAELVGEAIGVAPRTTSALRERSVGELTDLTFEQAQARYPDAFAAVLRREPTARPPGGETYLECRERAAALLERVRVEHAGGRVVLVSHNITLYQLVLHILGMGDDRPPQVSFRMDNCALHRFERIASGEWNVLALNERTHLEGLQS